MGYYSVYCKYYSKNNVSLIMQPEHWKCSSRWRLYHYGPKCFLPAFYPFHTINQMTVVFALVHSLVLSRLHVSLSVNTCSTIVCELKDEAEKHSKILVSKFVFFHSFQFFVFQLSFYTEWIPEIVK